jgi:CHAT domain-containing protein
LGLWHVLCLSAALGAGSPGSPPDDLLVPGRTLRKAIKGEQVHSFRLTAAEGQWFEIRARAWGLDLTLTLNGPDHKTLVDSYAILVGDADSLIWIADVPGDHILEVKGLASAPGTYELRMSEPRAAQPGDRRRLAAQSRWVDAKHLLAAPDRDRLAQVREKCQDGLAIARELEDPLLEGRFLTGMSLVHQFSGEARAALEFAQEAQQAYARRPGQHRHAEAGGLVRLGIGYATFGDYQKALDHLAQGRALFRELSDEGCEVSALGNLGWLYGELSAFRTALGIYEQVIPIFRTQGDTGNEARTFNLAGKALLELGDLERALKHYQRALALFHAEGLQQEEGFTLISIGAVQRRLRHPDQALDFLNRGLALARTTGERGDEALALRGLGDVYRDLGQPERGLDHYRQSIALAEAVGRPRDQVEALVSAAKLERDRGNLPEARRLIEGVTQWLDTTREGLLSEGLRLSYSGFLREAYDVHIDVLMRLHARDPGAGLARTALELSERGRGRTLIEMLHEARVDLTTGIDPSLLQREDELRSELNTRAARQLLRPEGPRDHQDGAKVDQEIGELTRQHDQVQTEIRKASPRYAALSQPTALTFAEMEAMLDEDTLLLEYQLAAERSYVWAVRSGGVVDASLGKGGEIEALARRLHQRLTVRNRLPANATAAQLQRLLARAQRDYAQAAGELSDRILGPLPAPRGKRLAIVADGALHYVPFAALPTPASWGGERAPLVTRYEVVNLPSASVVAFLRHHARAPAPRAVAVFADPVFDREDGRVRRAGRAEAAAARPKRPAPRTAFSASAESLDPFRPGLTMSGASLPRLEYTRGLAEALLEGIPAGDGFKAVDFEANREAALAPALAQYRIVVFATHGLLNTQYPELSSIALSMVDEKGEPKEGFLRLHDVYNLKLDADLVVLGACETGLGKEVRGEGLIGLSRGFLYAGAARLLASLWKVDEEATMALLKEFHRSVRRGQPFPAALREAQLQVQRQPRWRSPYFWAGFVLQGEWRGRETRNQ